MFLSQSQTRGEDSVGKMEGRAGESLEERGPVFSTSRFFSSQNSTESSSFLYFLLLTKVHRIID